MKKFNIYLTNSFLILFLLAFPNFKAGALEFEDTPLDRYLLYPEYNKTISMDFKSAPLTDVLKIFSQQSGLNFIAAADVADKVVNLYLEKVSVEEALDRILSANNLTYEIKPGSNIFVVKSIPASTKQPVITRVYPLKYATVPSSKIKKTLSKDEGSTATTDTTTTTGTTNTTSGIISAVKALLTENGSIVEDPRTNSLVVTDIASQFPLIEQTIARLDVRIPQILIEAEMLDISKKTADLLGAKWGDTPFSFNGAKKQIFDPFETENLIDGGVTPSGGQYTAGLVSFAGLKFDLQFLRTQTDTKSLARPRIVTLNNETAEIKIKTNEAIGLAANTTTAEGTATSTQEAERVETGIFLKVTPQVNLDTNEITMAIEPKVIQAKSGGTFGGQTFKDPEERGTKSILTVKDGDTIVLGGLLRTDVEEVKTRVPFLGDIPFLGAAFRHKNSTETERELVVFITPHIVKEVLASTKTDLTQKQLSQPSAASDRLKEIERALSSMEQEGH